jgi:hypothetical protein
MILEQGINFFRGDHKTGKTYFLWNLASHLNSLDKKMCFIGATNEHSDNSMFLRIFEFSFFKKDDIKTFELVLELRNSYDYIIIDDIDYIKDEYIQILFKSKKTIICTCFKNRAQRKALHYLNINYPQHNFYINNNSIQFGVSSSLPGSESSEISIDSFLKSITREIKIDFLLKKNTTI